MGEQTSISLDRIPVDDIATLSIILEEVTKCFLQNGQGIVVEISNGQHRLVSKHGDSVYVSNTIPADKIPIGKIVEVKVEHSSS